MQLQRSLKASSFGGSGSGGGEGVKGTKSSGGKGVNGGGADGGEGVNEAGGHVTESTKDKLSGFAFKNST